MKPAINVSALGEQRNGEHFNWRGRIPYFFGTGNVLTVEWSGTAAMGADIRGRFLAETAISRRLKLPLTATVFGA